MNELGQCVRTWRGRVSPSQLGLPVNEPRRTPGLRREELALAAGVSVDYLVRLEQGRASNPSGQVVGALSRALQLSDEERDHLYRLAHLAPPAPAVLPSRLSPGVERLLHRMDDAAVGVFDAASTLVAWNSMWAALMGDPSAAVGMRQRNLLWRHFTGGGDDAYFARIVRSEAETGPYEAAIVADLRAAAGRYPVILDLLVAPLRQQSPRFAELWDEGRVAGRHADRKTIRHPSVGLITVDCDVMIVAGSDLKLIVYTAETGSSDAAKLDLVRVIGLQSLATDGSTSALADGSFTAPS